VLPFVHVLGVTSPCPRVSNGLVGVTAHTWAISSYGANIVAYTYISEYGYCA